MRAQFVCCCVVIDLGHISLIAQCSPNFHLKINQRKTINMLQSCRHIRFIFKESAHFYTKSNLFHSHLQPKKGLEIAFNSFESKDTMLGWKVANESHYSFVFIFYIAWRLWNVQFHDSFWFMVNKTNVERNC